MSVIPEIFENPLANLSADQSTEGRADFVRSVIRARKENDPSFYKRVILPEHGYASLMITLATIILVILFVYAFINGPDTDQKIMVYSSVAVIGLLVSSGLGL